MQVKENVALSNYSTMALGGTASHLTEVTTKNELTDALAFANQNNLKVICIGGGSNLVWKDEGFKGLLIVNSIKGFEVFEEDETNYYITIGAGENWDSVVERSVELGLTGIEALSLIPGKAGATPIQNVGAYGQEISQTLTTVEVLDTQGGNWSMIPASDCAFGYRTSRFKTTDKGRFLVATITLHLIKGNPSPPFYTVLANYLDQHGIKEYTPAIIREAVINIRNAKLPKVSEVHNCGSFFANPVVNETKFQLIKQDHEMVPNWQMEDNQVKISAAWLIEQCGFKDYHDEETGMSTWPTQPLVLVNDSAKSTADLLKFRDKIKASVKEKFDIDLIQEPELLP
ncbi:MAG TPA: UDP-N-acetylmuramate dehydrogenase [Candidatus Sulfotelmatobacter sp.]|nr:UDP-N-acetylmuramate dehydrogenase [Candidatus Sulfotelmatobacter sp.]